MVVSDSGVDYSGWGVVTVTPETAEQVEQVVAARQQVHCGLDWWDEPGKLNLSVSVLSPPGCRAELERSLAGIPSNLTIADLSSVIREERQYRMLVMLHKAAEDWTGEVYHNLAEIRARVDWLVNAYPRLASKQLLATTFEDRPIELVVVRLPGPYTKPVIWLDCGIHSREWVSPPACLHAIERLIDQSNEVEPRDNLLTSYDFYILPVANPDGYVHSWQSDRMWRKNRRPLGGAEAGAGWGRQWGAGWGGWGGAGGPATNPKCGNGVDPNRNFPAQFEKGSSDHCDDSYHGTGPFSEAESQAIRKGVEQIERNYGPGRCAAFISIHAYSQFWMSPYGYQKERGADYKDHMRVMQKSVAALRALHGTEFVYGPISEVSIRWLLSSGVIFSSAATLYIPLCFYFYIFFVFILSA